MDWSIVITILGIVMGGGGLLFYKERRKGEQLKNEASAAAEWQKLYERADQDRRELDAKIDKLYVELSHFRDENNHLTTDNAILKLQKCEVNGCTLRIPPRNY